MSPADLAGIDRAMQRRIGDEAFLAAHPEYLTTTKRYPRSVVEVWPESRPITNACGIDGPPEPLPPSPLWVRLLRPLVHLPERLS